jgi:hypothetical protein
VSTEYRFLVAEVAKRMEEDNEKLEKKHFQETIQWETEKHNLNLGVDRLKKMMLDLKYQTDACLLEQRNLEGIISETKADEFE